MAMVCPRCRSPFEQRLSCPHCDVRLEFIDPRALRKRQPMRFTMNWQHTPWGRTLVGLLLAQGLFYGFRHLLSSALMGLYPDAPTEALGELWVIVLLQSVQLVALLLGGVIAGANQRHGVLQGAALGVVNGILTSFLHPASWPGPTTVVVYGTPLLHAVCGAVGAWLGYLIWTPLPEQAVPELTDQQQPKVAKVSPPRFKGPIAWFRVAFGTVVAAVGCISARTLLEAVLNNTSVLVAEALWQEKLITWEIQALAILAGGVVAGSGYFNGLKQGLCQAVGLCLVMAGFLGAKGASAETLLLTLGSCFFLSLVGGFFGSQLFPPVVGKRPRGMGPAAVR